MKNLIKNNFYFILILIFITVNFNTLEKIYLIHQNDYNQRLLEAYGYCDKEGYGFVQNNIKDKIIESDFSVKNYENYPSIKGFFYNFEKSIGENKFIFLINYQQTIKDDYLKDYEILSNEGNCYLLKKND